MTPMPGLVEEQRFSILWYVVDGVVDGVGVGVVGFFLMSVCT